MPTQDILHTFITERSLGAKVTTEEILQQPALWKTLWQQISDQRKALEAFMAAATGGSDYILFTGAGTSAFIGLSLHGLYFKKTGLISQAVATTDIVAHPADYFDKAHSAFIISFARSGNSPESLAALQLAEAHAKYCYHLIITCDASGALAGFKSSGKSYLMTLPKEANDSGLAMTSSYSGMLLTAIMAVHLDKMDTLKGQIALLSDWVGDLLQNNVNALADLTRTGYTRAVFLGSGPLYGTATEASLKVQELTGGRVICKSDSYLGFRHGPKAILNDETLIVFFLSPEPAVRRYELDLVRTIITETAVAVSLEEHPRESSLKAPLMHGVFVSEEAVDLPALLQLTLASSSTSARALSGRFTCIGGRNKAGGPDKDQEEKKAAEAIDPAFWPVAAIVPGQLLGLFSSVALGVTPDQPSPGGAISRVVQGVTIYKDKTSEITPLQLK